MIILDGSLLQFSAPQQQIQGEITAKSSDFYLGVCLHIAGFNSHHWLIILANGVDMQSFSRLKRVVYQVRNTTEELK